MRREQQGGRELAAVDQPVLLNFPKRAGNGARNSSGAGLPHQQ